MAKLWKDKTLRERVEVKLIALVNVETKNNSWGKHFWLTSSTSKVLARALENLKKVTEYELDNCASLDARDGTFAFQGGKIDTLIHSLWYDQQSEVTK